MRKEKTRLHLCRENVAADDRVLVVAPHPDDAEIAAFGLYADTRATVVTLTAETRVTAIRTLLSHGLAFREVRSQICAFGTA